MAGADVAYTYLHVFSPEVDSPVDMTSLVYPAIPLPVTTATTAVTMTATTMSFARNSTVVNGTEPEVVITTTTTLRQVVTSSAKRDPSLMTSRETEVDTIVVIIVACASAAFLLLIVGVILIVLVVRRHRHSGKYDPSRPHDGCRPHCGLCCLDEDALHASVDPEFDTSTVRLKLNTSAVSGTSTPADQSYVLDGVMTRTDPVQQTLIGPPLTNAAQSR